LSGAVQGDQDYARQQCNDRYGHQELYESETAAFIWRDFHVYLCRRSVCGGIKYMNYINMDIL